MDPNGSTSSSIFTLSIGETKDLIYRERFSKEDVETLSIEHNSLYVMTRQSQNFFTHRIEKGSGEHDRYSITFRCVDQRFRRSTLVLGDSNTKRFRFGEGEGTFGRGLPGTRKDTFVISAINPADCISYNNVVIHCGINDLTNNQGLIKGPQDVANIFTKLKNKVDEIVALSPKINVFVVPLLPTGSVVFNKYVRYFNHLIQTKLIDCNYKCMSIDVSQFAFSDGMLRKDCRRNDWDNIHLNYKAVRSLAVLIRDSIFQKYNSGRKSRVDGNRGYNEVVSGSYRRKGNPSERRPRS